MSTSALWLGTSVEPIGDYRAELGECPVWDEANGQLLWVDGLRNRVLRTNVETGATERLDIGRRPGAIALAQDGGLICASEQDILALARDGTITSLARLPLGASGRFNDGKCDRNGRFWSGTALRTGEPDCALYCFDGTGAPKPAARGVAKANGLGWSPDGRTMYFVDTHFRRLDAFAFDIDRGRVSGRRPLLELSGAALPDGLCVDASGAIWLAVWGLSSVLRITPAGRIDARLDLPTSRVSSCAFGGSDYRTLYVTTAREGATPEERAADPLAGALFVADVRAQGLPPHSFTSDRSI